MKTVQLKYKFDFPIVCNLPDTDDLHLICEWFEKTKSKPLEEAARIGMSIDQGCTKCGSSGLEMFRMLQGRTEVECKNCGFRWHPSADLPFARSSTPLPMWFLVMFLLYATRARISVTQIRDLTGVTYKCAWRMAAQIENAWPGLSRATSMFVSGDERTELFGAQWPVHWGFWYIHDFIVGCFPVDCPSVPDIAHWRAGNLEAREKGWLRMAADDFWEEE